MSEYRKLVDLLDEEIRLQGKILELLTKEKEAIIRMKQDESKVLVQKKEQLVTAASNLEKRRSALLTQLTGVSKSPKVSDAIEKCPVALLKNELRKRSLALREICKRVRDINNQNGVLLKQALGVISSTLAIIRSAPGTELPTYGGTGELNSKIPDPAFGRKRSLTTAA